jgi:hypothetical protein
VRTVRHFYGYKGLLAAAAAAAVAAATATAYVCVCVCVKVWRNFVHSYLVNCCGLLCCRTGKGQVLCIFLSWLTLCALIIACSEIHCGLKYQHWPMKRTLVVDQMCCQWRTVPTYSDKSNAQKLEIPTNIDVYSYRTAHRHASCSAGVIYSGCGVVTCNTQLWIY